MKCRKIPAAAAVLIAGAVMCLGCAPGMDEKEGAVSRSTGGYSAAGLSGADRHGRRSGPDLRTQNEQRDPELARLRKTIEEEGHVVGMAYLGFVSLDASEPAMRQYLKQSHYAGMYSFLSDAPLVDAGGYDLYAVVTTRKDSAVSVYPAGIGEDGTYDVDTSRALYKGKGLDCFLLRCNVSEIHSNAAVSVRAGGKRLLMYPMLSGKDGRLDLSEVYDFSIYFDDGGYQEETGSAGSGEMLSDDETSIRIASELLCETDEVKNYIEQGMLVMYTGEHQVIDGRECWIFALGTERDGQFAGELYYGVSDNLIYSYDALNDTWYVLSA